MNKNEKPSSFRSKGAAVSVVIGFVAVIVMVGAYTFNNYGKKMDEQLAKSAQLAEQFTREKSAAVTTDDILPPETEEPLVEEPEERTDEAEEKEEPAEQVEETTGRTWQLSFGEDGVIDWPASGAVLINYSMDKTTFFPTLEQYKYNSALIIGGQVGEEICSAAAGIVVSIEDLPQTGQTVTLDMGSGYTAIYGQLKDVSVAIGDYVDRGGALGYLGEPTKYFTMEGPNLYFKMMKDEEPVNPLNFME